MSTQTFVKRGKPYTAKLLLDSEADLVLSQYQVYVSINHEWSSSLSPSVRISSPVSPGDTEIQVSDGSIFSAGDFIIFGAGATEYNIIDSINDNLITLTNPVTGSHRINTTVIQMQAATRDSALHYSYEFSEWDTLSSGQYHIRWVYIQSGDSFVVDKYIEVYQPYITSSEFFDIYPELEASWDDKFDSLERMIRNKINTYCGQKFDFYGNKTQIFDGNNQRTLEVGMRLANIDRVIVYPEMNITNDVTIANNSHRFIYLRDRENIVKFGCNQEFEITGDWGWEQVPVNVTQAAEILLTEHMDESSSIKTHGVKSMMMDSESITFSDSVADSTGNIDADVLLLDYTIFIIGVV